MIKLSHKKLEEIRDKRIKNRPQIGVYLILNNIRSMYNVGAMIRTADAAGIDKIYLSGITAVPPRKEITKTALGAEKNIPIEYTKNAVSLIKNLKSKNVNIISVELSENSINYDKFNYQKPLAIIVGNEIDGVDDELLNLSDAIVDIPMKGFSVSLNVATAAGIILFEAIK